MIKTDDKKYNYIDGGICAAAGFTANGLNCGLNPDKNKNDLCIIYSKEECNTAAVYTKNKVKGAPIIVTKEHLEKTNKKSRAVIVNSKNANTCNADGIEKAEKIAEIAAKILNICPNQVLVASTGVIGEILPIEPFENSMEELAKGLSVDGNEKAATAIMTTDTIKKEVAVKFKIHDNICHLGGMAKGSGMIHPNMATTLNFITSDIAISSEMLQKALGEIVEITYNCLSIDGDTSTNDMVLVMANGLAGNKEITAEGKEYETFRQALYLVMMDLTKMLASDGEGATKLLECSVYHAPSQNTAITIAKSVIQSSLVKCLLYGEDANWGRIMCALGYSDCEYDIDKVKAEIESEYGKIEICNGDAVILPFSEEKAEKLLSAKEIYINIDLCQGEETAKAWGCDLTYDYVKINGDYRS